MSQTHAIHNYVTMSSASSTFCSVVFFGNANVQLSTWILQRGGHKSNTPLFSSWFLDWQISCKVFLLGILYIFLSQDHVLSHIIRDWRDYYHWPKQINHLSPPWKVLRPHHASWLQGWFHPWLRSSEETTSIRRRVFSHSRGKTQTSNTSGFKYLVK